MKEVFKAPMDKLVIALEGLHNIFKNEDLSAAKKHLAMDVMNPFDAIAKLAGYQGRPRYSRQVEDYHDNSDDKRTGDGSGVTATKADTSVGGASDLKRNSETSVQ